MVLCEDLHASSRNARILGRRLDVMPMVHGKETGREYRGQSRWTNDNIRFDERGRVMGEIMKDWVARDEAIEEAEQESRK